MLPERVQLQRPYHSHRPAGGTGAVGVVHPVHVQTGLGVLEEHPVTTPRLEQCASLLVACVARLGEEQLHHVVR